MMIINDSTPNDVLFPMEFGTGLNLALRGPGEYAYTGAADPFPDSMLIPRSEWQARIQERKERGIDMRSRLRHAKWKVKNQERTNYCHTSDTEVLTDRGWVFWPDYNWSDSLGTMNPHTGLLEFQRPIQRHEYEYDGEMCYSTHKRLDFAVTPDHKMIVKRRVGNDRAFAPSFSTMRAGDMKDVYKLPHATTGFLGTELIELGVPDGHEYDGDDFIQLMSYIVADGWASKDDSAVGFCCFDPKRYHHAAALAARCGFREQPSKRGDFRTWDGSLAHWVRSNCYVSPELGSHTKKVPDLIKWASQRQIALFLACYGDQNHTKPGRHYFSTSNRVVDDLQEMFLRVGRRATITQVIKPHRNVLADGAVIETKHPLYELYPAISERLNFMGRRHMERERYRGTVYCAGVPNHSLITRRNDDILISSNCWINAPTASLEMARIRQGQKHVVLSPASGGGPIKRFRNVGGWGLEALQWIAEFGLCPVEQWPANAIDSRYYTEANKKLALDYCVREWYEIKPRSLDHLISALFRGPVPVGYSWWGHEVCATDPVWLDGAIAIEIANSWGESWGDDEGFGIIQGSRMLPDDAVSPRTAVAA